MEAPDKIYLTKNRIDVISQFFHSAPIIEDGFVNIEYIRKDALLEWAKSQKARLKQGYKHEWKNSDIIYGGNLALDNLIEKIESL